MNTQQPLSPLSAESLTPGFQSPALDAQIVFRSVMDAWSRPGRVASLPDRVQAPEGLDAASAAVALTLVDADTAVWLSPACRGAADWLRFHCNCPLVAEPAEADFAFATTDSLPELTALRAGTALSPELGATVLIAVPSLKAGPTLTLTGPGIETREQVMPAGLEASFWVARDAMRPLYPAGVDLILTCGQALVCLPRTTSISREV